MWAQGNQWGNPIPLDAAAYQNMNHELVDWASLAQQWIRMKEVHETVVLNVPEMGQSHYQNNINLLCSSPVVELQPSDSSMTSGEAPMDVDKEDEITSAVPDWSQQSQSLNKQTLSWPLQGHFVPRNPFPQVTHPGAGNLPAALGSSQAFLSTISPSMNLPPRVPLLPLPPSVRLNSSDEDSLGASSFNSMPTLDASKRKNLPAWIREGLEKMEKEKQKKEEREKFLLEREVKRKKELESGQGDLTIARSRFDDSEEDDDADEIKSLKESTPVVFNPSTLEDIMVRIRQLMTEILLEVTTEEIRSAALEASQRAKVKNRQVQSPLSSKSLTRKLGLDQYGSDSEGDDSDQETVKAYRTSRFDDGAAESFRGKNYEEQHRVEESQTGDRFSQVEENLNQFEKPAHSVELEKNKQQSSGDSFSKVLQDGTKVDTKDINSKFPHGPGHVETLNSSQKEESAVKSENISYCKSEISVVRENSLSSKSQDRSNVVSGRSRQRSRTPERRKRSRSRDCQYNSRRSRDYPKSRRRSRSRGRKRSDSRRRSRDRRRSSSKRRSRSNDRKCSSSKGKERASSKDRRR